MAEPDKKNRHKKTALTTKGNSEADIPDTFNANGEEDSMREGSSSMVAGHVPKTTTTKKKKHSPSTCDRNDGQCK